MRAGPISVENAPYKNWAKLEQSYRLVTCGIWFVVGVALLCQLLQLSCTCNVRGALWGLVSPKRWFYLAILCLSQAALLLSRHRGLAVSGNFQPWGMHMAPGPAQLPLLTHLPVAVLTGWSFSALAGFPNPGPHTSFLYGGLVVFALSLSVQSLICNEHVLRFPSLQRRPLPRLKGSLRGILTSAGRSSLCFCVLWLILYGVLSGLFRERLGAFTRAIGPAAAEPDLWAVDVEALATFTTPPVVQRDVGPPSLQVIGQLYLIALLLALCWNLGRRLLEIFFTDPLSFEAYLLSGLQAPDPLMRSLALQDLLNVAQHRPEILFDAQPYFIDAPPARDPPALRVAEALMASLDVATGSLYQAIHKPPPARGSCLRGGEAGRCSVLFADGQQLMWTAQALSFLTAASIGADRLGTMQYLLPKILLSLLQLSQGIEDYIQSASFLPPASVRAQGHQLLRTGPAVLAAGLDNAIYRIVVGFFQQMHNVKMPPKHAVRLRAFMNFAK